MPVAVSIQPVELDFAFEIVAAVVESSSVFLDQVFVEGDVVLLPISYVPVLVGVVQLYYGIPLLPGVERDVLVRE